MSLKTWKEEFYPVEAQDCPKSNALAHSHRKWVGLRPGNLAKHGVTWVSAYHIGTENEQMWIDDSSCALCYHYLSDDQDHPDRCTTCPLYPIRYLACDEGKDAPFRKRVENPEAMIELIEAAMSKTSEGSEK